MSDRKWLRLYEKYLREAHKAECGRRSVDARLKAYRKARLLRQRLMSIPAAF